MKAAIYNPYLNTLGGGERYSMAVATSLRNLGYQVDVEWRNEDIKEKIESRFGISLKDIHFIPNVKRGDGYDLCFWVSDGSIPLLRARKNFLHFQIPFSGVNGKTLFNRMKFFRIDKIICNSYFTKDVIDNEYGVKSIVIYPPVDVEKFKPRKKEDVILAVGRFSQLTQAKRQDVLVEVFKIMVKEGLDGWSLVLAGGIEVGAKDFVNKLEKTIHGYPIQIIKSPDFSELKELYGKARILWSASGFGEDENKDPKKVEHFGIDVIEAMAAGAVSIAYNAGGHREIIDNGSNGFLWQTKTELKKFSQLLVKNRRLNKDISKNGVEAAKIYEYQRFEAEIGEII